MNGPLSSIEPFGFEDDKCFIPRLPETRYGFAAFKASQNQLAVCGGWWEGKPDSTDCLTLDTAEGQWVRGAFEGNLFGEGVRGVASFDIQGIYIFHTWTTSILQTSNSWTRGPEAPVEVECGCKVSDSSFVIISSDEKNNVMEYSITNQRWEDKETWPEMKFRRKGPGCGATSQYLLVAGGVTQQGEVLANVEIFTLDFKSLGRAANMSSPRSFFNLVPVGLIRPKLLAIGGRDETTWIGRTEFFEEEDNQWEEGPQLGTGRSDFASIMIEGNLGCTDNIPSYTCPAKLQNNTETICVFDVSTVAQGTKNW